MILSILQGDVIERLRELPDESVQCVVTSSPYFNLRVYGIPPSIWDVTDPDCKHEWTTISIKRKASTNGNSNEGSTLVSADSPKTVGLRQTNDNEGTSQYRTDNSCFCQKCNAWKGCLGNEPDPRLFVKHLVDIFKEVYRVLRSDGVCFANIGDSYMTTPAGNKPGFEGQKASKLSGVKEGSRYLETRDQYREGTLTKPRNKIEGIKHKDLLLVPERLAIGLQDSGWYVRSRIAWVKNSILPESVRDRPTNAWEHIWMITKSDRYYWDKEAVEEDSLGAGKRNLRNWWLINPKPFRGAHFACFPPSIPERAIKAATSEKGCCPHCRAPWKRIVEKGEPDREHQAVCGADSTGGYSGQATKDYASNKAQDPSATKARILEGMVVKKTIDWQPTCTCPPHDPVPCLVLDPFSGAATTLLAAKELSRDAVGIELNKEYIEISKKRLDCEVWDTWMW